MTEITDFLIAHGVLGMFIAAFLAGTFLPFASEVVLLGLLAAGADPVGLLIWGTIGNLLGGMFNYWIGTKGKEEWIEKYAKVKPQIRRVGRLVGLGANLGQHTHSLDGLSTHQPLLLCVHDCLG